MSIIDQIDTSKAIGYIDAETKFIKLAKPIIAPVLANLINECFNKGVYLKCLKMTKVIPIFKKCGPEQALITAQYRFYLNSIK